MSRCARRPSATLVRQAPARATSSWPADATGCERVGLIGFCMGGMYALKAAGLGRFARVVSFYGMIRVPRRWTSEGQGQPLKYLARPGASHGARHHRRPRPVHAAGRRGRSRGAAPTSRWCATPRPSTASCTTRPALAPGRRRGRRLAALLRVPRRLRRGQRARSSSGRAGGSCSAGPAGPASRAG